MRDLAPIVPEGQRRIVEWVMPEGSDHILLADFGLERLVRLETHLGYQIVQAGEAWFRFESSRRFESNLGLEMAWHYVANGLILKEDRVLFRFSTDQDSKKVLARTDGRAILRNSSAWQESLKARRLKYLTEALSEFEPWPEVGLAAGMLLLAVSLETEFVF